ncbi:hypothetical protein DM02DRAFT_684903 [Periconia macrospinosa]|uniref:Rhodopsin domain-containing protein n=1 Tax=Periconia macrospinosa TaxID=97972 RepID=A0A2V1DH50_9PLEO|nr:hypothetical protein DM02DRAFT_684903 [Periconia macrospinosa]
MTSSMDKLALLVRSTVPFNGNTTHPKQRERIENAAAKLDKTTFLALVGIFTGVAVLAASTRIFFNVRKRGKLFVDDMFAILATCCLIASTGFIYYIHDWMYIAAAMASNPKKNGALYTKTEIASLRGLLKWNNLFFFFAWTCITAVKFSFLALFWLLIRDVSRPLLWLWWFTVAITTVSWIFNGWRNAIVCGWSSASKCAPAPPYVKEFGWTSSALDITTDLLIILIPILLLRNSLLRWAVKLRILGFLCLNLFQIAICLARTIGGVIRGRDGRSVAFGMVYIFLLIHVEASVAVIMSGVTAFWTVFAARIRDRERQRQSTKRRSPGICNSFMVWLRRSNGKSKTNTLPSTQKSKKPFLTGEITGGTLRGLGTFIRRHERESGLTTNGITALDSQYDPLQSYHEYIRKENTRATDIPLQLQTQGTLDQMKKPEPSLQLKSNDY